MFIGYLYVIFTEMSFPVLCPFLIVVVVVEMWEVFIRFFWNLTYYQICGQQIFSPIHWVAGDSISK